MTKTWIVPSETVQGREYIVKLLDDGRYVCTCPDHVYRRRECKHIRKVKREYEVEELDLLESPIVKNPLIRWDRIQKREYQLRISENAVNRNTLVVLPTALGKTLIAVFLSAYYLYNYPFKKVLVMAPTRPLVHQHYNTFINILKIKPSEVKILTGEIEPAYRLHWWSNDNIKLYFATPEVVRNDLEIGLNLRSFSLLVFDEAHRARKNYAYSIVAEAYMRQSPCPVILGLTASPGGDEKKVREIVDKLYIEHIEYRSEYDEDVKKYIHGVETEYKVVEPPQSYGKYVQILREMMNEQLHKLIAAGVLKKDPEYVFRRDLLEIGEMLRFDVNITMLDEERGRMWDLIIAQSTALILYHAIDLLLSQGQYAFTRFLEKIVEEKRKQSHRRIARDPRFRELLEIMKKEKLEEHPKIPALIEVLREEVEKNPGGRILVFTQYRDSAEHIVEVLKSNGFKAEIFVGQGRRGRKTLDKRPSMTQKQQLEVLQKFRDGELKILVATSIGEEGLDIPQCDLVVFYEPVPSEVRLIQRRGRTGRAREGRCVILVADKTLDMVYLVKAGEKVKKMRKVMEKINQTLPPRKNRIWGEAKPISEEYIVEAEKEFEEFIEARMKMLQPIEKSLSLEEEIKEVKPVERPLIQRVAGAPEPPPADILLKDEEKIMYKEFRSSVSKAIKKIVKTVFREGGLPLNELIGDLEWDGFSRGVIQLALKKLTSSYQIYVEDGVVYPYARKIVEKVRGNPEVKTYRIYVEEVYPGKIVAIVNDRWRAVIPMEFIDSPIPLRKRREYKVLGKIIRLEDKINMRIYGVLRGEV
ncbi:MAG: helicase-related protein [Nitrososphaerota archaeon]